MESEMLISNGDPVKGLGDGMVGGYGAFYTSELQPDLDGDFFDKNSNFELEDKLTLNSLATPSGH